MLSQAARSIGRPSTEGSMTTKEINTMVALFAFPERAAFAYICLEDWRDVDQMKKELLRNGFRSICYRDAGGYELRFWPMRRNLFREQNELT